MLILYYVNKLKEYFVKSKLLVYLRGPIRKALTFCFYQKRNGFPPGLRDRSRGVKVATSLNSCDAELNRPKIGK